LDGGDLSNHAVVPIEYVGLARAFLREIWAEEPALTAALTQFGKAVAGNRPGFRQRKVTDVLRDYRKVAPERSLIWRADTVKQGRLDICEVRLTPCHDIRSSAWEEDGSEASMQVAVFLLSNVGLAVNMRALAVLGRHAVARWFQRTGLRDYALLRRDLAPLGALTQVRLDEAEVPCERGRWLGRAARLHLDGEAENAVDLIFHVRTFMDRDA
jgi:hypothetical protein